jgi:hypothetical protein
MGHAYRLQGKVVKTARNLRTSARFFTFASALNHMSEARGNFDVASAPRPSSRGVSGGAGTAYA